MAYLFALPAVAHFILQSIYWNNPSNRRKQEKAANFAQRSGDFI